MMPDFPSTSYDAWKLASPPEPDTTTLELADHAHDVLDTVDEQLRQCRLAINEADLRALYKRLVQIQDTINWLNEDVAAHLR